MPVDKEVLPLGCSKFTCSFSTAETLRDQDVVRRCVLLCKSPIVMSCPTDDSSCDCSISRTVIGQVGRDKSVNGNLLSECIARCTLNSIYRLSLWLTTYRQPSFPCIRRIKPRRDWSNARLVEVTSCFIGLSSRAAQSLPFPSRVAWRRRDTVRTTWTTQEATKANLHRRLSLRSWLL